MSESSVELVQISRYKPAPGVDPDVEEKEKLLNKESKQQNYASIYH